MVPHAAWELVALLLELIQQLFHLGRLLSQLRAGHGPGVGVGVDQAELLERRGSGVPLHDAGDLLPALRVLFGQELQRRPPPVAGNDDVTAILFLPDQDRLLQVTGCDICSQILDSAELVEIIGITVDQVQPDIIDLFPLGVQIGHTF